MLDELFVQKGVFKNCIRVDKTQDGLTPFRFTAVQLKEYAWKEDLKIRSYCPSGVCMDFETDAASITFEYSIQGMSREWAYFDIYVNNIFVEAIGTDSISQKNGEFYYEIPRGRQKLNRITIYLPHLVELSVKNIRLPEGAAVKAIKPCARNLLCLGDSITQGMEAYHPSVMYPLLLSRFLGMNLLNQGVGGGVYNAAYLDGDLPYNPDIITVAYGTNDWNMCSSLAEFNRNCSEYIAKLFQIYPDKKIYVITPFWRKDMGEIKKSGSFSELCETVKCICHGYPQIDVIDGMEIMPHLSELFGDKFLHPNDHGFMHVALNLLGKMKASS
jgi:Lysophospholipase L1 and related esterases